MALIAIVVIWASYNYFLKGKIRELSASRETLSSIEKEIDLMIPKDIIAGKSEATNLIIEKKLGELGKKLPSEIDIPYLMQDFITNSSRDIKINYSLVQPSALISEQKYKKLPIDIELSGDFENLNLYLVRLENLPMMVRIDQLDINKNSDAKVLDVKLLVSAFVMPSAAGQTSQEKIVMPGVVMSDPFFSQRYCVASSKEAAASKKRTIKKSAKVRIKFKGVYEGSIQAVFLNDSLVKTGESVDGFTVEKIGGKSVTVSKSGKRYTLKLGGEI